MILTDNGRTLISASFDTTIRAFDLATGRLKKIVREVHSRSSFFMNSTQLTDSFNYQLGAIFALSATEKIVATGSSDRSIRIVSLKTYRVLAAFKNAHQGSLFHHDDLQKLSLFLDVVRTICLTSDSKYVISGSTDSCIKVSGVMSRQLIHSFNGVHHGISSY